MSLIPHKDTTFTIKRYCLALLLCLTSGAVIATDCNLNNIDDSLESDLDSDGHIDDCDNCLELANASQLDSNSDGYGNRCDADLDNNGRVNATDLAIFKTQFRTSGPDADFNGDGRVNATDLAILKSLFAKPPGPGLPEVIVTTPVWQKAFEDNFDGPGLDSSKWTIETGPACPRFCDADANQLHTYSADNVTVADGALTITGEDAGNGVYTSGRVSTAGKFDFRYGRVVVNARVPAGQGTRSSISLLPADTSHYGPWPLSGEINLMQASNYEAAGGSTQSGLKYGLDNAPNEGTSSSTQLSVNADTTFHEYAMEWENDSIRFYVDGRHFQTQTADNWYSYYPADANGDYNAKGVYTTGAGSVPFDRAFHLLLDFAIGGDSLGNPDGNTLFPQTLDIDSVRVYQCVAVDPAECRNIDASIQPLKDLDGSSLEGEITGKPYIEKLDIYVDGPETVSTEVDGYNATTTLVVDGYTAPGASVFNNPDYADPADPGNTVWHVIVSNGLGNVYIGTADLKYHGFLDSGFDFSGNGLGQLVFDIKVDSLSPGALLTAKMDSGYPDLGQLTLPTQDLIIGSWQTIAINFEDLLANPGPGAGLDLDNVINAFVLEVSGGDADFYLDNIRVTHACRIVGDCQAGIKTKQPAGGYESPMAYPGYQLVWNDEFNGTALNLSDWTYEYGNNGGWGNNELQYYRSENTWVGDGLLTIEARQENYGGANYTSSRIKTQGKQSFRYGKVDIRAAMPRGQGLWPALWMLGESITSVGWPACGEIDIMEMVGGGDREDTTYGTIHWDSNGYHADTGSSITLPSGTFADEFHVFGLEWDSTTIKWFLDGQLFRSVNISDEQFSEFQDDFFFIFNVAVGGNWPGYPDSSTWFPQRMRVDYIRVFEKE